MILKDFFKYNALFKKMTVKDSNDYSTTLAFNKVANNIGEAAEFVPRLSGKLNIYLGISAGSGVVTVRIYDTVSQKYIKSASTSTVQITSIDIDCDVSAFRLYKIFIEGQTNRNVGNISINYSLEKQRDDYVYLGTGE